MSVLDRHILLKRACLSENIGQVKALIQGHVFLSQNIYKAVKAAASVRNSEILGIIEARFPFDPLEFWTYALIGAYKAGDQELINQAYLRGGKPNKHCLIKAGQGSHLELVKDLWEKGIALTKPKDFARMLKGASLEIVKFVGSKTTTPHSSKVFGSIVRSGNSEMIEYVIDTKFAKASANAGIYSAARIGSIELIKRFLPYITDKKRAFEGAIDGDQVEIFRWLEKTIGRPKKTELYEVFLDRAFMFKSREIADFLGSRRGISVEFNPTMVLNGNLECFIRAIELGCDSRTIQTCALWAYRKPYLDIIDLCLKNITKDQIAELVGFLRKYDRNEVAEYVISATA